MTRYSHKFLVHPKQNQPNELRLAYTYQHSAIYNAYYYLHASTGTTKGDFYLVF